MVFVFLLASLHNSTFLFCWLIVTTASWVKDFHIFECNLDPDKDDDDNRLIVASFTFIKSGNTYFLVGWRDVARRWNGNTMLLPTLTYSLHGLHSSLRQTIWETFCHIVILSFSHCRLRHSIILFMNIHACYYFCIQKLFMYRVYLHWWHWRHPEMRHSVGVCKMIIHIFVNIHVFYGAN